MLKTPLWDSDGKVQIAKVMVPFAQIDPDAIVHEGSVYVHRGRNQKFCLAITWDTSLNASLRSGYALARTDDTAETSEGEEVDGG